MPKLLDLLSEVAAFGEANELALTAPEMGEAFGRELGARLKQNIDNPAWLHGQRVQAMFEALLIALGEFEVLKTEDSGSVFPPSAKVPDFRVVLKDGEQWLIEVKNVYNEDPHEQRRLLMKKSYREALEAYAKATGAKLKLAVYWARWSIWTLVSPDRVANADGDVVLEMTEACAFNELSRLGDRSIATTAPLKLRLLADPERTSAVANDGTVQITFAGHELRCADRVIEEVLERQLAWIFMEYGEWLCDGPFVAMSGDKPEAVEFRWEPPEPTGQGFDCIATLSRMFSRYFADKTVKDGAIVKLKAPLRPGWFAPLLDGGYKGKALPLWRFSLEPNYEFARAA